MTPYSSDVAFNRGLKTLSNVHDRPGTPASILSNDSGPLLRPARRYSFAPQGALNGVSISQRAKGSQTTYMFASLSYHLLGDIHDWHEGFPKILKRACYPVILLDSKGQMPISSPDGNQGARV